MAITFCGAAAAEEQGTSTNPVQDTSTTDTPNTDLSAQNSGEDTSTSETSNTNPSTQNTVQNTQSNTDQATNEGTQYTLASTMASTSQPKPEIVITFDDGFESVYTVAFPKMQEYGIKGTVYVVTGWIGAPGYLTQAQLTALKNAGWTIANHSYKHNYLPGLTETQVTTEIQTAIDYLNANGFSDGAYHFAYPYGGYNDTIVQIADNLGIKTARTTVGGTIDPTGNVNYLQLPIKYFDKDTTEALWKASVDLTISTQTTTIFLLHNIVSGTPVAQEDVNVTTFNAFIDYVAQTGVSTLTISQWYNEYHPLPVANFTAAPTSGAAPLEVQFTDQSTENPTSWAWDFNNDGIVDSTLQNPTYIYNSGGTFTVKLTVTNSNGSNSLTKTSYITVKAPIIIPGSTQIISTTPSGGSANNNSNNAKTSADGRYIVYESTATNIVSGDTNGVSDIFLYDTVTKTTIRANRGPAGLQANGGSFNPSISADGRYIVYESDATNLVSTDSNGLRDIFLYDTITKTTIRVNRGPSSAQAVGGGSFKAEISADGRYIVYESDATNLVSGDNNSVRDIFLYDKSANKTIRANRGPASAQAVGGGSYNPSISADGRYIVYESDATNLVSGDGNGIRDIFLYDKTLNKTIRANRGAANAQAVGGASKNASISADGRYIVYESTATNLVSGDNNGLSDIFVYDSVLNKTIRANRGAGNAQAVGGGSFNAAISADGRYVVYESDATNLVSGDTNGVRDIFLYDMTLNKTIRANRGPANAQLIGGGSFNPSISSNGKYIVYGSDANDIVPNDSNGKRDIFLYPV